MAAMDRQVFPQSLQISVALAKARLTEAAGVKVELAAWQLCRIRFLVEERGYQSGVNYCKHINI